MVGVVGVGDGVRVDGVVLISSLRGRILFWWEEREGEENLTLFMYKVQVYIQIYNTDIQYIYDIKISWVG